MAQTAVVTGSVIDADTGTPIPGAVIAIPSQGITVTAGPAGDFRISNALPGEAVLQISAPGYEDSAAQTHLYNGQSVDTGALRLFLDFAENEYVLENQIENLVDATAIDDENESAQAVGALTGSNDDIFYRFTRYG